MALDFNINLGADAQKARKVINTVANEVDVLVNNQNVISISADTSKAKKQVSDLDSSVQAIQDKKIKLELDAESTQKNINQIETQLDLLTKEKKKISVDLASAENDILKFKNKINDILENEANLKIDSSTAQSEIEKIKKDLSKIEDVKAQLIIESGNSESVINSLQSNLNDLQDKKIQITADLKADNFETVVKQVEELDGKDVSVNINVDTEGFADIGAKFEALENVGGVLTGIAEKGTELNQTFKEVQAQTGLTGSEFENLKTRAENAFVNGIGGNVSEATKIIANADAKLKSFLDPKGVDDFTLRVGGLAKTFDVDVNETISKSRTFISAFALEGAEAGDILAYAFQKGGNSADDLLDTTDEYSQLVKTAGFNAQEFVSVLTTGIQAGTRDTDKLADAIKETQIRLNAGDITKSLKDIKSPITDTIANIVKLGESGKKSVKDVMLQSSTAIKDAFDSGQISASMRDQLNVAISGTMAEDIGGELYTKIFSTKIDTSVITANAKTAGDAMIKAVSPSTVFAGFEKQVQVAWSKVSSAIAPIASQVGGALTQVAQLAPALKLMQDYKPGDFSKSIKGIKDFANQILFGIVPATQAQAVATGEATVAQEGLNTAQKANPIGAIVLAIVALVGAMYLLYQNVESVRKVFDDAFAFMKDVIGGVITALEPFKSTIIEIGKYLFNVFTVPFQIAFGIIKKLAESFSGASNSSKTFGEKIAGLKPIFEKISVVVTKFFEYFNKAIDFLINLIVAVLTPPIQFLITVFGSLVSFLYDSVLKVFETVYNALKPILDGIAVVATKAGEIMDSVFGDSADKAIEAEKNVVKATLNSVATLNKQKTALFGLKEVNAEILNQKRAEIEATKKTAIASANQIKSQKEQQKQLGYINSIYADADKQLKALESQIVKTNKNVVKAPIDPEALKKAKETNLEIRKLNELETANQIEDERKRLLEIAKINFEYDRDKLKLAKATNEELKLNDTKYAIEKAKINREQNVKDFERQKKINEDSAKNYELNLKTELSILQDFIDNSIATEEQLTDFKLKSLELRKREQDKNLQDVLATDTEYLAKEKELLNDIALGKIDTAQATESLKKFAQERIDTLSKSNNAISALIQKNAIDNAKFEEKLELQLNVSRETIRINSITELAERERQLKILEAKKTLVAELDLAKENSSLKLQAELKYLQAVNDANNAYELANRSTLRKIADTTLKAVQNSFINLKAIIRQTTALADPKELQEFSAKESELQKLREEGAISYEEYARRYKILEQEKADATAKYTKTSIDWVATLNKALIDAFQSVANKIAETNVDLANKFANNLELIGTASKEFGANSTQVTELTSQNQKVMDEAYMNTGVIVGATFMQMIADGKSATKAFVLSALAGLKALVPIITAKIYAEEIASKSFAGLVTAPLLVAAITGLLSAAEGGLKELNFAKGGLNIFGGFGDGLHTKEKSVISRVGETGRAEYVLNPDTTARSLPELKEINSRKMSIKEYVSEKMSDGLAVLDRRLQSIEKVLSTTKLVSSQHAYNIVATNNVVQSVNSIDMFTR